MKSFKPNKVYLAQWDILKEFPHLKKDFAIRGDSGSSGLLR